MTNPTTPHIAPQARDQGGPSPFDPESAGRKGAVIRRALLVAGVGAALVGAWWFTRDERNPTMSGDSAVPADAGGNPVMLTVESADRIGVTYATVELGTLATELRTVGLLTYDETRVKTIAPKVEGFVEQLFVAFTGQPVERGDSLLRIYSPMLVTAQEELLLARKLVADMAGAGPEAVRTAESMLAGARRRLSNWDVPDEDIARVERTGAVEKSLTIRSPLSGVVVRKAVQAGQRVMAGEAVYQVADLHEVWLEGEVFEQDLAGIRLGQEVQAEFGAMPGRPRRGRIVYVAPSVSPETRTTQVRVALANHDMTLKPGMYATLHIRGTGRANVLTVPRSAVLVSGQRVLVFVRGADGMLTPRAVELGTATDDRIEVIRGVSAGEVVVSSSTFLVDAESNLDAALGAMANMPGMDMGTPRGAPGKSPPAKSPDSMPDMPGMDHGPKKKP
jgi:Cu(I)/Ag(I) efflux system membrane fusion protein